MKQKDILKIIGYEFEKIKPTKTEKETFKTNIRLKLLRPFLSVQYFSNHKNEIRRVIRLTLFGKIVLTPFAVLILFCVGGVVAVKDDYKLFLNEIRID